MSGASIEAVDAVGFRFVICPVRERRYAKAQQWIDRAYALAAVRDDWTNDAGMRARAAHLSDHSMWMARTYTALAERKRDRVRRARRKARICWQAVEELL